MFGFIQVTVLCAKSRSSLNGHSFTALFKNKRILKFKSQLTFGYYQKTDQFPPLIIPTTLWIKTHQP